MCTHTALTLSFVSSRDCLGRAEEDSREALPEPLQPTVLHLNCKSSPRDITVRYKSRGRHQIDFSMSSMCRRCMFHVKLLVSVKHESCAWSVCCFNTIIFSVLMHCKILTTVIHYVEYLQIWLYVQDKVV